MDDIIIFYTNKSWGELGTETRGNGYTQRKLCFFCFFCSHVCLSLQSVDRFGQVCHIVALGAWVCGEVPAQCLCVEGSLLFTKE